MTVLRIFGATATRDQGRTAPVRRSDINRAPWPALAYLVPWLSIVLASATPGWPFIASMPFMPPLGFLMLLGWRQLHPGLLPVWVGLPLGIIDDLVSGQPAGSGVMLWSVTMLGLEVVELRWPWRNFVIEWAVASAIILAYLLISGIFANGVTRPDWLLVLPPQILISILIYPVVGRLVGWLDRIRLSRFRTFR